VIIVVESNGIIEVVKNRSKNIFDGIYDALRSQVVVRLSEYTSSLELLMKLTKHKIIAELRWALVGAVDFGIVLISVIDFAQYLEKLLA
jgi:hypothetical protein